MLGIPRKLVVLASRVFQMRFHVSIRLALRKLAATVRLPAVVFEAIATHERVIRSLILTGLV